MSGVGLGLRWPMSEPQRRPLRSEDAQVPGRRSMSSWMVSAGRSSLLAVLDYPLRASHIRQAQVKQLASSGRSLQSRSRHRLRRFNAGSLDEIRMLTGRSATAKSGLVLGGGRRWLMRTPGPTTIPSPPSAFDYIFSAWPRRHGVGHRSTVRCSELSAHLARTRYPITTAGRGPSLLSQR